MQSYFTLLVSLILVWFLGGCAISSSSQKYSSKVDSLLVEAMLLESQKLYDKAAEKFKKAYYLTGSKELLKKAIQSLYKSKKFDEAVKLVEKELKNNPKDVELYQLISSIYLAQKDYKKAEEYLKKALEIKKDPKTYEYLASLFLEQKRYELALKYYKSAYALNPSPQLLSTIATIMYFYLEKPKEAIAYLETHSRMYGCDKKVCNTLISLYGLQNNIEGLISVYKRYYTQHKDKRYLKKLVDLYVYQKDYPKAIKWAKELGDEDYILDLYKASRKFEEAYDYALKLYQKSKDLRYLAEAAIFEYEKNPNAPKEILEDVVEKLEKAITKVKDPVYLNYLGYLYIDHDLNVPRGIELVKEALKKEPNSPYYLDSLAWGYYKVGKCDEALKIIKKVYYSMGFKDSEVEKHLKEIERCVKGDK
ncbi:MAG: tetratricopeptide repeat protein [Epsilonproteobacteria bacterium]|nr:tetratricopeptide repeat protein [Campylobacterota bacterium]